MTLYFLVGFVPWMFFSPVVQGGGPLAGCDPCPANGLMIADRPDVAASLGTDLAWAVIALLTATIVLLAFRLATASRPRRRTLLPVYVPALLLTIPLLGFHGFAAGVLQLDAADAVGPRLDDRRSPAAALPFGFLLAIVQASLFAGERAEAADRRDRRQPERAAAARRSSPTRSTTPPLELVFRVDGATGSWTRAASRSPRRSPPTGARRAPSAARARRSRRSGTTRR